MRVLFIGCVDFSRAMLNCALKIDCIELVGIVTKYASEFNADFYYLLPIAEENKIPCFLYDQVKSDDKFYDWVNEKTPDVIYCFGWSHLLDENLITIPKIGVVGHHPALLPRNRGRHPVIWSLVLGLERTASSFFFIDLGVDSGDIIDQVPIDINFDDDAGTLYRKIVVVARKQLRKFSLLLEKGTFTRQKQDESKATFWRKRTKADGCIDWRMNCKNIYNLVRALAPPYVGAHCMFDGQEIKVWRVGIIYDGLKDVEPGKIINVDKDKIYVRAGDGVICIYDHEFDSLPVTGGYL